MARVLEAQQPPLCQDWLDRVVVPREVSRSLRPMAGIVVGFGLCYGVFAALGGNQVVSTTWHIPIILFGAARFR